MCASPQRERIRGTVWTQNSPRTGVRGPFQLIGVASITRPAFYRMRHWPDRCGGSTIGPEATTGPLALMTNQQRRPPHRPTKRSGERDD